VAGEPFQPGVGIGGDDQTLMAIAAAATAMMAGTSQPGTRAPDEDTSQAA
jgi:hypothetical protein